MPGIFSVTDTAVLERRMPAMPASMPKESHWGTSSALEAFASSSSWVAEELEEAPYSQHRVPREAYPTGDQETETEAEAETEEEEGHL